MIGSFNGWDKTADPLTADNESLWTLERELPAGSHEYQFCIDGELVVCDPYAREVVDELSDTPKAVLRVGAEPFHWRNDGFQRPRFRDLIIYELSVGDFSAEGTFQAVIDRLDHIRALGANAIQLMPITEAKLDEDWGYQPTYYFAARNDYGTEAALKELIDAAHGRGIAVILDLVLAHTAPGHPFHAMYGDADSPWYGEGVGGRNDFGLPTFDHRREPVRAFARDVQTYWLKEFHADGFRYDYAINIGVDGDKGVPFLAREARKVKPDAYLIGEYLPEDPKLAGMAEVDATWHIRSSFGLKALARHARVNDFDYGDFENALRFLDPHKEGYEKASHMINYIESHDEQRIILEMRQENVKPDAARFRLALAATVLMTAPGVPMIYAGQEYGEDGPMRTNERNPLRWALIATKGGKGLLEHYTRLAELRRSHPALRDEGFAIDAVHNDEKWVVYHRWDEAGDVVVVAANFGDGPRAVSAPFPEGGKWREVFSGEARDVTDKLELSLEPDSAAVFVRGE